MKDEDKKIYKTYETQEKVRKKHEKNFCISLAKALRDVEPPKTVGLYVPLGSCKKELLKNIEEYMKKEKQSMKNEQSGCWKNGQRGDSKNEQRGGSKNGQLTFRKLVSAIFTMTFYSHFKPLEPKDVHNIFIHFSAWQYAGTDHVWAGLITALCDGIEKYFGRVPMSVYRIMEPNGDKNWSCRKYFYVPLYVAILLICGVVAGLVTAICLYGVPLGNFTIVSSEVIMGLVLVVPGCSIFKMVCFFFWNAIFTQKAQLVKKMNRTDVSGQLGFMGKVKKEVKTIISYLQFMETVQKKKFRVVLKITSLDQCAPEKVMSVLEAMNLLLSGSDSPFISILVADLIVIMECVESRRYAANNGYKVLSRIINLPFSIPKIYHNNKIKLGKNVKNEKKLENRANVLNESELCGYFKSADQKLSGRCGEDCQVPLKEEEKEKEADNLIHSALDYLKDENMKKYVISNKWQRLTYTIVVMARFMVKTFYPHKFNPKKVASWVVLANQWPCRLSWILQCIEDDKQMGGFSEEQERKDTTLLKVYETYMEEFDFLKDKLKKHLELDGDPEVFQNFLSEEFEEKNSKSSNFLVEDVEFFLPCTVNLDSSLKRRMELERGNRNLNWTKNTDGLSKSKLLEMSEEDICEKMEKLHLKNAQEYKDRLRKHHLHGRALVYSKQKDIKKALDMSLGDWVVFRMHFLEMVPAEGLHHSIFPFYYFANKKRVDLQTSPPLKEEGGPSPSKLSNNKTSES
ncbi:NTPase KAP family P-loop domain-containing protein 1-like [Anolis sagrei]|uniref:NTPase KAP family P-loop domain-containing protein 1-like n=1 Tax=Anolis sagrei TaxID=38937 RepID=UPI0035219494